MCACYSVCTRGPQSLGGGGGGPGPPASLPPRRLCAGRCSAARPGCPAGCQSWGRAGIGAVAWGHVKAWSGGTRGTHARSCMHSFVQAHAPACANEAARRYRSLVQTHVQTRGRQASQQGLGGCGVLHLPPRPAPPRRPCPGAPPVPRRTLGMASPLGSGAGSRTPWHRTPTPHPHQLGRFPAATPVTPTRRKATAHTTPTQGQGEPGNGRDGRVRASCWRRARLRPPLFAQSPAIKTHNPAGDVRPDGGGTPTHLGV